VEEHVKTFSLEREQYIPLDIETVFDFFADAGNLERLTPSWLHFEILTPLPIAVDEGTLIDYKIRLRGLNVKWQSEIVDWNPRRGFVDRQRKGPYRLWVHEHCFETLGSGTIARDLVDYAVPGDDVVNGLFVRPDLERIFDFRAQVLNGWALERLREATQALQQLGASRAS
jgi:ligand-binding SRPBCC domain-containing protein